MTAQQAFEQWLAFVTDSEKQTLLHMTDKEKEDAFYTELSFGTAGMRGVLGLGLNRMNVYNIRRATQGLAAYLRTLPRAGERGVVIGYDSRRMSDVFAKETALVLCSNGIKALLFDTLRPVPVVSFAIRHLNAVCGVVITASHNPPEYNGYKVYAEDGAQLSPEAARRVTDAIRPLRFADCAPMEESAAKAAGLLQIIGENEVDDAYQRMVQGLITDPDLFKKWGDKLRMVYTPLHGSGNVPVRRALRELGIANLAVVTAQEAPDGAFPTVKAPNPEDPNAFTLAKELAEQVGADVLIGTDPDCDRLGVCVRDGQGRYHTLTGNQIGCLMLHHILSSHRLRGTLPKNGAAVKSIVSTELSRAICDDFGVALFDTLTGFKFIGEKIEQFEKTGEHTFLFGFEESFGYLSSTAVRDKDAVNAAILITEAALAAMDSGITLYDRLQQIARTYGCWQEMVYSFTLPGKDGMQKMQAIMQGLRAAPLAHVGDHAVLAVRDYLAGTRTQNGAVTPLGLPQSDVLYYELAGGHWLCVRPSGTEPKIKLYVSTVGDSAEQAQSRHQALYQAAARLINA